MIPPPALDSILIRRQARHAEWAARRATQRCLTPSAQTSSTAQTVSPAAATGRDATLSRLIGISAHAVLEQWDFNRPHSEIDRVIAQTIHRSVTQDHPELTATVSENLTALLKGFFASEPYHRLQRATVLGREVPFVTPLGQDQMMEGVIDLIYRLDGRVWIADYKTDAVSAEEVRARADRYRSQAKHYSQAVASALGLSAVSFQLIFIRPGIAVDLS